MLVVFFFLRFYLFLDRGREGERERNISVWLALVCPLLGTWPATQACALNWELNPWPFGLQVDTQYTEPHQPGLIFATFYRYIMAFWNDLIWISLIDCKGYTCDLAFNYIVLYVQKYLCFGVISPSTLYKLNHISSSKSLCLYEFGFLSLKWGVIISTVPSVVTVLSVSLPSLLNWYWEYPKCSATAYFPCWLHFLQMFRKIF